MGRARRRGAVTAVAVTAVAFALLAATAPQAAEAAGLQAGVGRADITPPTGYAFGGWTRADRRGNGQHTRLQATAMVLERDGRKIALVAVDLFAAPGGLVKAAAKRARAGFSERNVLVSASHTHAGPSGFANFDTFNTLAPSVETVGDPSTFVELFQPQPPDRQLYTFLVKRIAKAIRRADRDRAPAAAAWGSSRLLGVTRNRSLEAHLANHGIEREYGEGSVEEDPRGYPGTVDPSVNVLRVDKLEGGRRVPIGAWSTFANHGTVNPSEFEFYNQDHHGAATRGFEARVRRDGDVPDDQEVVNVYGNSNEGDMSAGLINEGPARAERVGNREARAMHKAWQRAGRDLTSRPQLDYRWTRVCFCGQETEGGRVADSPLIGLPFLTGSEEGRGPLFDVTRMHYEGRRNPAGMPPHGHKVGVQGAVSEDSVPNAVPLSAIRIDDRLIASIPGEPTLGVGDNVRREVMGAASGAGVSKAVVSGLANEFLLYFTTPEEYDRQHYEGGASFYGRLASNLLVEELGELSRRLVRGRPAQPAYPFDPRNGLRANAEPFGRGATDADVVDQPRRNARRLRHATFAWHGGPNGLDRPLDRAFVTVERRTAGGWRRATDDLGLEIVWSSNEEGDYEARWEVPHTERRGRYRFVVSANRYRLASRPFRVRSYRRLRIREASAPPGRVAVRLGYPRPRGLRDFTARPGVARGGSVEFRVGSRTVEVRRTDARKFSVAARPGQRVRVRPGDGRDRHGNRTRRPARFVAE